MDIDRAIHAVVEALAKGINQLLAVLRGRRRGRAEEQVELEGGELERLIGEGGEAGGRADAQWADGEIGLLASCAESDVRLLRRRTVRRRASNSREENVLGK